MVEELERLRKKFDDFRAGLMSDLEKPKENNPKDDFVSIDRSMRIEELERRLLELEKMFAVFNKNWKDYRGIIDKKVEDVLAVFNKNFAVLNKNWEDYRQIMDRKTEELNLKPAESIKQDILSLREMVQKLSTKGMPENIQREILSLKEIVQALSNESQKLRQRLEQTPSPQTLIEMTTKISSFENKLSEVEEKLRKDFWSRPVVLE